MRTFAPKPNATHGTKPAKPPILARAHCVPGHKVSSIGRPQRTVGDQAAQPRLETGTEDIKGATSITGLARLDFSRIPPYSGPATLQAKLTITPPGDIYEQEAERISEQVMKMPGPHLQRDCTCGRGCPKCQAEWLGLEPERLQTKRVSTGHSMLVSVPPTVHEVLASQGQPLDWATRAFMEPRFGLDFSEVRVHTGAAAAQSAREVHAHAYTVGQDIVFGAGQFAPETREGRLLIAHELTHVRQQSAGQTSKDTLHRSPDKEHWGFVGVIDPNDPRFLFWVNRHGNAPATLADMVALWNQYQIVKDTKGVLEEYDRAQLERDRLEFGRRRLAARDAEDRAIEARTGRRQNRTEISTAIRTGWSSWIKALAANRPMNPLQDFEPGIHDYSPYQGQPESVDMDIVTGDFDTENITIEYTDGKELEIPLNDGLLFPNKPLDPRTVLRVFTRRHKKTHRLIPFVIYEAPPNMNLDALSEEDLALMGLPRFDPLLTPYIMYFLSFQYKMQKLYLANLKLGSLHAASLGLRQLGVPLAASAVRIGVPLVVGAARTGGALVNAAARQVAFSITTYGYSAVAATYLGRTAYTYYLNHAVEINQLGILTAETVFSLFDQDMGFSLGDELNLVIADANAAAKEWKLIHAEVEEVNLSLKQARARVTKTVDITERAAKEEYALGKKVTLIRKTANKGKGKLGTLTPARVRPAAVKVSGNHTVRATPDGITLCSPDPCPLLRNVLKKELTPLQEQRLLHAESNRFLDPDGAASEAADIREEVEVARLYASGGLARDRRTATQYQRDLAKRGLWGESRIGAIVKRKLARDIERVLPPTSSVDFVAVEGSEAGVAQVRAAGRKGAIVGLEVEPRIDLPNAVRKKAGLYVPGPGEPRIKGSFKPDDIEFLSGDSFRLKDHKEVTTIWEESFYSSDKARDKLRELLLRDLDIARALAPNCKGFAFTTDSKELKLLLAELIADLPKDARALLHPPL